MEVVNIFCSLSSIGLCIFMVWVTIKLFKANKAQANSQQLNRGKTNYSSNPLRDMVMMDMLMRGDGFFDSSDPLDELTSHALLYDMTRDQERYANHGDDYYPEDYQEDDYYEFDEDQYWDDQADGDEYHPW